MKTFLVKIFFFLLPTFTVAQFYYEKYLNCKLGEGISYGGTGLALEYRYKKISFNGSIGFKKEQYRYDYLIPSSWNFGFDIKYYISKKNANWQFFSGLHTGWLSNYYHPDIGQNKYEPTVYGICFLTGIEVRDDLLNIELGLTIDPGKLVLKPETHPYYTSYFYINPSLAVGINLYALKTALNINKKNNNKKIKNKEEFEISSDKLTSLINEDSLHNIIVNQQAKNLLDNCSGSIKTIYEKAYYNNDTLYIFKPVSKQKFVLIKAYLPNIKNEQFLCYNINDSVKTQSIIYLQGSISAPLAEDLPYIHEEFESISYAKKGVLSIYIKPPFCYVSIENIHFNHQGINIFFDKISICELKF